MSRLSPRWYFSTSVSVSFSLVGALVIREIWVDEGRYPALLRCIVNWTVGGRPQARHFRRRDSILKRRFDDTIDDSVNLPRCGRRGPNEHLVYGRTDEIEHVLGGLGPRFTRWSVEFV